MDKDMFTFGITSKFKVKRRLYCGFARPNQVNLAFAICAQKGAFSFFCNRSGIEKNNTIKLNHISICDTIRQLAGRYEHLQKIGNVPTKNRQVSASENYSAN